MFFCRNDTLASCSDRFDSDVQLVNPTTFKKVEIKRKTDDNIGKKKFYLPITLTTNLMPIDYSKIEWISEKRNEKRISLVKNESRLLSFAIYGRNLANDGADLTKP